MVKFLSQTIQEDVASSMRFKNIWSPSCPVSLEMLRLLTITHYDFDGNLQSGEMVVHEEIADNVIMIFQELLEIKFPIAKIRLMDHYNGDDNLSMTDNNSSCFNYRMIANSSRLSMHSYGLAIDINPVQNPCIIIGETDNDVKVYPDLGKLYLNRNNQRAGMLEPVVGLFARYGLIWGGSWNTPIDYHHFQVDRNSAYWAEKLK